MGYRVTNTSMDSVIAKLRESCRVYAPKISPQGDVRYGEVASVEEIVFDRKSDHAPKEVIYPIVQAMLYFADDTCTESVAEDGDIVLFVRPCDIHALQRLDAVFLRNGDRPDMYYARMRSKVKFFMIECTTGWDTCFCVSMGANQTDDYSVALRPAEDGFEVHVRDDAFAPLFTSFPVCGFTPAFVEVNEKMISLPVISGAQTAAVHSLAFWQEYEDLCISCGGCNAACGTCGCFDTVDIVYTETSRSGERRRVWACCMQPEFSAMAGGHNVRRTQGERMRFKVMHKIHDFQKRFGGRPMCVGCGRCAVRCPKGIAFADVVSRLHDEMEKGGA